VWTVVIVFVVAGEAKWGIAVFEVMDEDES